MRNKARKVIFDILYREAPYNQGLIADGIKEIIKQLIFQFGYRGVKKNKPVIHTAGLSALEEAFEVLGWEDPHYLPEQGFTCEVKGCMNEDTVGMHWGNSKLYLRLCSEHHMQAFRNKPIPEIKQYALDREAKRDPITGILESCAE